ncbi:DUF2235 domain-containing protein [Hoeflea prorocentri]|uniref:DUF2235 domain-containing protein n=1 Tax=Hoeflea prorocentri TaxID=1922333 RepID=A0A9X3UP46_9HYPH|nr:DUF2235 domain-containing protein [Hoeflea prorocentri]MCY6382626.1 DUF2235 domain-containing protein [Hoeflea prorocentri]MDA5400426.1 DUF2235 domain-containing protein [Hoeflea prorocentri]
MADRLILCLDGTWNSSFNVRERDDKTTVLKPTNPLKLARAVLPHDSRGGTRQITYYDSGVGAQGLYPGLSNKLLNFADSKLGGGWGAGFEANIEQATTFISNNYSDGDQIYIFGFSRGAAQARGLTNFISWLGGVPAKDDAYYIPIFFRHYLENGGGGSPLDIVNSRGEAPAERITPIKVTYLGVWDTVMALGSRFRATGETSVSEKSFHVREIPADCVLNVRQGLAIDEKRYDFRPEVWRDSVKGQSLEQRWFAGAHGNVGGSYGDDGMANVALHWIVDGAKTLGLAVDEKFLAKYRQYVQDEIGDTHTLTYKAIELLRLKRGKGFRKIDGYPESAKLSIDPSVIKRLCSDPSDHTEMTQRYRPRQIVEIARKHKHDWEEFIRSFGLDPAEYGFPEDI